MVKKEIFLGSDHAGFELKEKIKERLNQRKIKYKDLGPSVYDGRDDYPDYAFKVAKMVSKNQSGRGILVCGTGAGMAIAANKVKGIRAVEAYDAHSARMSRLHNDSNILTIGARNVLPSKAIKIVDAWVNTSFSEEERHKRRIEKIKKFENSR